MHGNNERAKTSSQRTSFDDAFRQRASVRFSFFFVLCAQAYVNTYFFFSYIYIFLRTACTARSKNKGARPLVLPYSYTYTQQKSSRVFFFDENDKADRKSLQQAMHGVEKKKRARKRKDLI